MQCPNCEAENRDDANFCDECGFPLSGSIARVAGAASPRKHDALDHDRDPLPDWSLIDEDRAYREEDAESHDDGDFDAFEDYDPAEDTRALPVQEAGDGAVVGEYEPIDPFEPDPDAPYGQGGYYDEFASGEVIEPASWFDASGATEAFAAQNEASQVSASQPWQADGAEGSVADWPADYTMEMPRVEKGDDARGRDFRLDSSQPQRRRGKFAAFIVAGVAVGAVVAALVTYALGLWGGVTVPDVTGMTEPEASAVLSDAGFAVRTTQVKSDDTEGLVLIMDPGAGSRAPEGSEIVIHIATTRFVPDIVGKSGEEAKALLEEAGYENVRFEMQKSDDDENVVLEVSPDEGTRAKSNAEIVVKVSEAYRVPDISGLDPNSAVETISEAGLSPEVVYIDTDQFPDGSIIGTNPESGTKVSEGAYVSISVARARGVELVGLTESMFAQGNTVTIGGVDYEIESIVSVSYQGDDTVAFTVNGRPKITFFGETLYASSSQTVSGLVAWSEDNEVVSIS